MVGPLGASRSDFSDSIASKHGTECRTGENVFITKHVAPVPRPVACAKGLHAHTLPLDYDIEDSDG